jgi:hypothetical protein
MSEWTDTGPPRQRRKAPARHLRGGHGEEQSVKAELLRKLRRSCKVFAFPRPVEGSTR